jgi:hypothetical protein
VLASSSFSEATYINAHKLLCLSGSTTEHAQQQLIFESFIFIGLNVYISGFHYIENMA